MSRLVALVLCLAGCDAVFLEKSAIEDCPLDYMVIGEQPTRYRVVKVDTPWPDAAADCADDADGLTHLVVFDRVGEIDEVRMLFVMDDNPWVGYARDAAAPIPMEAFASVFGDPLPMTNTLWNNGEPSNAVPGEPVVQLRGNGLNDTKLDDKKHYICECDGKRATREFVFQ